MPPAFLITAFDGTLFDVPTFVCEPVTVHAVKLSPLANAPAEIV